jgi:hypothetical protein
VIYRYAHALLTRIPMLAELIERETAEAIDLTNGVTVEIMAASFRSVRGYTLIAALCDEIAFWRSDDSANPDVEIIAALRPQYKTLAVDKLLTVPTPTRPTQPTPTAHRIGRTRISPCIAVSPRSVAAQNHGCDLQEIGGNRE